MTDTTETKLCDVYTAIHDTELNSDDKRNICGHIQNLYDSMLNDTREKLKDTAKEINVLQNKITNYIEELDNKEKFSKQLPQLFNSIAIVRQILNVLFNNMWDKYYVVLKNINYESLAGVTVIMKRKYVDDKKGIKFALAILNNVTSINFPKEICELYIKINDMFHPKIKPIAEKIGDIGK